MSHAAEGSLQAYIDGELDSTAAAAVREHVASCPACEAELNELRALGQRAHTALALLDAPAPVLRAQARLAREAGKRPGATRRRILTAGGAGFAKAAMLLIALAGAGAAVIPGSPLRDALQNAIARVFGSRTQPAPVAEDVKTPVVTPTQVQDFGFAPSDGSVRIVLRQPTGDVLVRVRSVDDELARIETDQPATVSFRSAEGRAELRNIADAVVTISIPRAVPNATIEIDGAVYVSKQGGTLRQVGRHESTRLKFEIEQ